MLKNYIKIAWRNLVRNRAYSLINTIGLSVGMASCLLIFLFIQDELSYDCYHENSDRIYRVYRQYQSEEGSRKSLSTSKLLAPTLEEELAGVEASMRLSERWPEVLVEQGAIKFYDENFFFADPSIFEIFSFRILKGNPETALDRPFTVVLCESIARKYFGDSNPIGKTLTIRGYWGPDEYEVTGVMEDIRHNSHFTMNFLTSFETLRIKTPNSERSFNSWYYLGGYTYVMLGRGVTTEDLTDDLEVFVSRHHGEQQQASVMEYRLQPVTDIHLYSHFGREIEPNSDVRYLYIFGSIALLILFIAGINCMNLATARSTDRAVEVGVQKTLGVGRPRLIAQFLCESLMFCLISLVLALFLAEALLPYFNALTGKPLSLELSNPVFILSLIGLLVLIGVLAGIYPAFVLSRFRPRQIFSSAAGGRKKSAIRNALVVFQFTLSIALIVGTLIITDQLDYIREKRLGLTEDQVVSISTAAGTEFRKNYHAFKDRLLSYADIEGVTHVSPELPSTIEQELSLAPEGLDHRGINNFSVGKDFIQTLEIPLKKGRDISDLSSVIEGDSTEGKYMPVLINEAAVREWGWEKPLGKVFDGFRPTFRVAGVVGDFHYRSLKEQISPLILWPSSYSIKNVLIRINADNVRETVSYIEEAWNEMGPGTPMDYTFLDDQYDSTYKAEDRLATIFSSFTLLAVLIACLGLFGLVAYTTERRTKEIGIRKVLGATVSHIVGLLSKDFLKLVLLGFVIAIPVAWYAMNRWLQDFAYRIEIGPGIFALAGGAALLIALLTVSWQSVKAALANPVESLRSE